MPSASAQAATRYFKRDKNIVIANPSCQVQQARQVACSPLIAGVWIER
jgi:hypothetical protein